MGKPLSVDLRARALSAVDEGMSRRAAARRFGVSESSVIRWDAARRATGSFEPKPQGGDMRSRRIEELHAAGVARIYSPDDGRAMGLQGMINDLLERCAEVDKSTQSGPALEDLADNLPGRVDGEIARLITHAENLPDGADIVQKDIAASSRQSADGRFPLRSQEVREHDGQPARARS